MRKNITKILALAITASVSMGTLAFAAPSEIYAHRALNVWDYHQTNYDDNGNVRYKPSSTAFKTVKKSKEVDVRIPNLSSNDTLYGENVEINFDKSGEWKNWSNNIYKVVRADIDSNNSNLESDVIFHIKDNKIVLDKQSKAINYNDKMRIKIYSKGYESIEYMIHIVREAPELRIHPDFKPVVGQDILFELKNFNYGVVNPIYEVILDGKVLQGGCKDYHIISNLVRLERGGVVKTPGKHTIVIKAIGFKDAVKQFIVEEAEKGYKNPEIDHNKEINNSSNKGMFTKINTKDGYSVDCVTSASLSGSSEGSSANGSTLMPANLIFDFDLVANAYILRKLGMETKESEKVLEFWETSLKDGAVSKKSNKAVNWSAFTNAVMDSHLYGKHLTFDEYVSSNEAEEFTDKFYNVKYVLEDGLLGETQLFEQAKSQESPKVVADTTLMGQDVVLTFESNKEWKKAISSIKVGSTTLSKNEYKIENGKITISNKRFAKGENTIFVEAKGFKNVSVSVFIKVKDIDAKVSGRLKVGSLIEITNLDSDYIRNINHITLNGKSLLSESATGSDGDYKTYPNKVVLNEKLFNESGRKVLILKAYGYEDKIIDFNIDEQTSNGSSIEMPVEKKLPKIKAEGSKVGEDVIITFDKNNEWKNCIKTISINNWNLSSNKYSIDTGKITIDKSAVSGKGKKNIEIKADGYKTISIQINMVASAPKLTVEKENLLEGILIKYPSSEWTYGKNITSVELDGIKIEKKNYKVGYLNDLQISKEVLKAGNHKIVVKAEEYDDVVLDVNIVAGNTVPETKPEEKTDNKEKGSIDSKEKGSIDSKEDEKAKDNQPADNKENKEENKVENDKVNELKDAPTIEDREVPFIFMNPSLLISNFTEDWSNNISEILVNDEAIEKTQYSFKKENGENRKLEMDKSIFKKGKYHIVIRSTGYRDMNFTYTIGM